jgi:hypothetical protein
MDGTLLGTIWWEKAVAWERRLRGIHQLLISGPKIPQKDCFFYCRIQLKICLTPTHISYDPRDFVFCFGCTARYLVEGVRGTETLEV